MAADPAAQDNRQRSPLHFAARGGHTHLVRPSTHARLLFTTCRLSTFPAAQDAAFMAVSWDPRRKSWGDGGGGHQETALKPPEPPKAAPGHGGLRIANPTPRVPLRTGLLSPKCHNRQLRFGLDEVKVS
jgi:ankyrin repeat protein